MPGMTATGGTSGRTPLVLTGPVLLMAWTACLPNVVACSEPAPETVVVTSETVAFPAGWDADGLPPDATLLPGGEHGPMTMVGGLLVAAELDDGEVRFRVFDRTFALIQEVSACGLAGDSLRIASLWNDEVWFSAEAHEGMVRIHVLGDAGLRIVQLPPVSAENWSGAGAQQRGSWVAGRPDRVRCVTGW